VPKYRHGVSDEENQVGAVTGLAWTEVGGELLTISVTVPGKGAVRTTGKLGEVMSESVQMAFSFVKARSRPMASSPRSSSARTSTSTFLKAPCPRTGRARASAW
jgi:ATP-dependent Lon protease